MPGYRRADDRHPRPTDIARAEIAAGEQRNPQGLEITRRHKVDSGAQALLGLLHMSFRVHKAATRPAALERSAAGDGGREHSGNRLEPRQQLLVGRGQLFALVTAVVGIENHQQHVIAAKAQVKIPQSWTSGSERPRSR